MNGIIEKLRKLDMDRKTFERFRRDLILFLLIIFMLQRGSSYLQQRKESNEIVFYTLPSQTVSQDLTGSDVSYADRSTVTVSDADEDEIQSTETADTRAPAESVKDGRININTASSTELQELNGIGPALAGRIIDYRNSYGKFVAIEEIMEVKGIGEKTFEKIRDHICVK